MSHFRQLAPVWGGFALATLLWTAVTESSSIPMNYCSSINTASMAANHSIYQSDGLCHDFCNPSYALAIVQGDSCWCSNLVPDSSTQVSTDECNNPCPGFPSDVCGGDGLYGYMLLSDAPSGTVATGQPASTASSTVQTTVTSTPNSSTLTASRSSSGSSSLSSGMTTLAPTVQTVTAGGTVRTVTVTPTVAIGSASSDGVSSSSSGLSTGAAVGVAVGIVALVAILAGIGIFFFLRRRREREADGGFDVPSARGSSAGMMNTPKTDMSESRYAVGPDGRSMPENWESDGQGRRRSKLMPVDPRMDPFGTGIYARPENKSHDSIHSLRDDQDYSRRVHEPPKVLRATNPDPVHDD